METFGNHVKKAWKNIYKFNKEKMKKSKTEQSQLNDI
jgi:hypothetical protein